MSFFLSLGAVLICCFLVGLVFMKLFGLFRE